MKGMIILANGFEDVEAIATIDVLRRASIQVDIFNFNNNKSVLTSSSLEILVEDNINNANINDYDFLIIPGGKAVFKYLYGNSQIESICKTFNDSNKLIACICAAPSIIGKLGFLKDKEYTCFPGCEDNIIGGIYSSKNVCTNKNIITAKSMYYSQDFGLEIVKYLLGENKKIEIEKQIKGEK